MGFPLRVCLFDLPAGALMRASTITRIRYFVLARTIRNGYKRGADVLLILVNAWIKLLKPWSVKGQGFFCLLSQSMIKVPLSVGARGVLKSFP